MKILVTGGAGYIGSIVIEQLLDIGHEVVALDNLSVGHRAAVDPRAEFAEMDLADRGRLVDLVRSGRFDAVMHFAANAEVGESMENPTKYFRNNVANGIHLLEAVVAGGVRRIVFSSTCATYGIPERMPITEETPQNPVNPYGESKLAFERILRWYDRIHGIVSVSLRYFNAAGASERFGEDHEPESHLVPNVLRVPLGKAEKVPVFGNDYPTPDGTCIRDYVHVKDLGEAHILALEYPRTTAFNLGTGRGSSVLEVVETARRITGHPIPVEFLPRRPGDPPRLVAGAERAAEELGWKPRRDLEEILRTAWDWHRRHPDGYGD